MSERRAWLGVTWQLTCSPACGAGEGREDGPCMLSRTLVPVAVVIWSQSNGCPGLSLAQEAVSFKNFPGEGNLQPGLGSTGKKRACSNQRSVLGRLGHLPASS